MNYDWGENYTLPTTLTSIIFGYYQSELADTSITTNITDANLIYGSYYNYNNNFYYYSEDESCYYVCDEIEWLIVNDQIDNYTKDESNHIVLTLLSNLVIDYGTYSDYENSTQIINSLNIFINDGDTIEATIVPNIITYSKIPNDKKITTLTDFVANNPDYTENNYWIKGIGSKYYCINEEGNQITVNKNDIYGIRSAIKVTF